MTRRPWRATHRAELLYVGDSQPTAIAVELDDGLARAEDDSTPILSYAHGVWRYIGGGKLQVEPRVQRLQGLLSPWTAKARRMLSTHSLGDVAAETGLTRARVATERARLRIPPAGGPGGPKPRRGSVAERRVTVRLTDDEGAAFEGAAGSDGIAPWLRGLGRKATGLND